MFKNVGRRLFGKAVQKRTTELGAAYLELARINRIDDEAIVEFRPADVWKATPETHRRIREHVDAAAVELTNSLASGLPLPAAAARYAAMAARGADVDHARALTVLQGLGGDAADVGRAVVDFWTRDLGEAVKAFARIDRKVALSSAPVEAASSLWSSGRPRFAADLAILGTSPAAGPRERLALADLLISHARHDEARTMLDSASGFVGSRLAAQRDALLDLNERARAAGTDKGGARTLAVFNDVAEGVGPRTSLPVVVVDRTHNRFGRHSDATWLIASGAHIEPSAGGARHFPYHPAMSPLFVGWACDDVDLLTPNAIAYLAEHGPVGCADAKTHQILAVVGVPCFVSGPLSRLTAVASAALAAAVTAIEGGASAKEVGAVWSDGVAGAVEGPDLLA